MNHSHRGFSLVEILVALATVAALTGLAFAGWERAVAAAHGATCLQNLRTIGIASAQYSADTDGRLPGSSHQRNSWIGTLQPYLGTRKPYRCPLDSNHRRVASYALNDALSGDQYSRRLNIARPSQTMFMAETSERFEGSDHLHVIDEETGELLTAGAAEQIANERHFGGSNFLFVDGHVEPLPARDLVERLASPSSAFLQPAP